MEITPQMVYLISRLDILIGIFGISGVVTMCLSVILMISGLDSYGDERRKYFKLAKIGIFCALMSIFCACVIPNENTVMKMVVIPRVVNDARVRNITDNSLNVLNNLLNRWDKMPNIYKESE